LSLNLNTDSVLQLAVFPSFSKAEIYCMGVAISSLF